MCVFVCVCVCVCCVCVSLVITTYLLAKVDSKLNTIQNYMHNIYSYRNIHFKKACVYVLSR